MTNYNSIKDILSKIEKDLNLNEFSSILNNRNNLKSQLIDECFNNKGTQLFKDSEANKHRSDLVDVDLINRDDYLESMDKFQFILDRLVKKQTAIEPNERNSILDSTNLNDLVYVKYHANKVYSVEGDYEEKYFKRLNLIVLNILYDMRKELLYQKNPTTFEQDFIFPIYDYLSGDYPKRLEPLDKERFSFIPITKEYSLENLDDFEKQEIRERDLTSLEMFIYNFILEFSSYIDRSDKSLLKILDVLGEIKEESIIEIDSVKLQEKTFLEDIYNSLNKNYNTFKDNYSEKLDYLFVDKKLDKLVETKDFLLIHLKQFTNSNEKNWETAYSIILKNLNLEKELNEVKELYSDEIFDDIRESEEVKMKLDSIQNIIELTHELLQDYDNLEDTEINVTELNTIKTDSDDFFTQLDELFISDDVHEYKNIGKKDSEEI